MHDNPPGALFLRLLMATYFCAGVGYVISATFIVAIVNRLPGMEGQGSWIFLVIGLGLLYWEPLQLKRASRRALEVARG